MLIKIPSLTGSMRLTLALLTGLVVVFGYMIGLIPIGVDHLFDPAWVRYTIAGFVGVTLGWCIDLSLARRGQRAR